MSNWVRYEWVLEDGEFGTGNLAFQNKPETRESMMDTVEGWKTHIWSAQANLIIGIPTEDDQYWIIFIRKE